MSAFECPRCHGSGEIQFNDSPNKDPQHDDSAPCGTCHGDGTWTAEDDTYERAAWRYGMDGNGGL